MLAQSTASKLIAVGGSFTLGTHANLVFFDPAQVTASSMGTPIFLAVGDPNARVNVIATNGSSSNWYVGGNFSQIGGALVGRLREGRRRRSRRCMDGQSFDGLERRRLHGATVAGECVLTDTASVPRST